MEKTPEEMAAKINKGIANLKTKTVSKNDFKSHAKAQGKVIKQLKKQNAALEEKVNQIKDYTQNTTQQKGVFVKFVEKNLEKNKDIQDNKNYQSRLTIKAPALMTTANVTPNAAGGYSPLFGNYVDANIGSVPKPEPFILPLVNVTSQPGTEKIWYIDRVNEEGNAEFIGEGDLKPLIDAEWKTTRKDVKEVAERWKFSKRLMQHAPSIVDDFRIHANELIENRIDDGIVSGDGTGNTLEGIEALASAFIVPTQLANYYPAANIYDVISAMSTAVRLNNFKGALTAVLNPVWKAMMQGVKDNNNNYVVPPFVTRDGMQVGETRVVFSNKFSADKIMVGDLKRFNVVIAEDVQYDEGYENDDFSKNLVSRKLEAFLGTYIKDSDAGSIVMDDIATVLTAIVAP